MQRSGGRTTGTVGAASGARNDHGVAAPPPRVRVDRDAIRAAGWRTVGLRDVLPLSRTLTLAHIPRRVPAWWRAVLAVWSWPAWVLALVSPRHRYHRGGRVSLTLRRELPTWVRWVGIPAVVLLRPPLDALRDTDTVGLVVVLSAVGLLLYVLTVSIVAWARGREERSAAERRGLFRVGGGVQGDWVLGRIEARDAVELHLADVDALLRAALPPGTRVRTFAASDRQQRAFEEIGFVDVRGHKGEMLRTLPGTVADGAPAAS